MVVLELSGLTKRFGPVTAVDRADLAVRDGELLAIVGESGCGKTTTLRLIAGLETPDAGAILIGGVPMSDVPPGRRNVQMIFQNFALWPHMKVFDPRRYTNLTLPLKVRRWSEEKIQGLVRPLAERLGIDERLYGRKPGALSGGEQQRVALGRA
ncbi:MAG TPA: ABC transporter ATP-binding protein, partial [Candidatus Binatia bacterium]